MSFEQTLPRSEWPETSFRPMFMLDLPLPTGYVEASVVSVTTSSTTYAVTCPAGDCPDGFPEQTLTHISGSSWEGQHVRDGRATSWGCNMARASYYETKQFARCSSADAKEGDEIVMPEKATEVDICFALHRTLGAQITAGMDKLYEYQPWYDIGLDPENFIHEMTSALTSSGCPITESRPKETGDVWGWAPVIADRQEGEDEEGKDETKKPSETATTGPAETGTQTSGAEGDAEKTEDPGSSGSVVRRGFALLFGASVLAAAVAI